ncbi:MAG: hypothetical protein ACI4QT_06090 [Kiritimatiellia bacterium]
MLKSRKNAILRGCLPNWCIVVMGLCMVAQGSNFSNTSPNGMDGGATRGDIVGVDHAAAPAYKEPGFFWSRPRENTSEAQFARAKKFEDEGSFRKARNAYEALVCEWGDAPEAPEAQLRLARLMEKAERYERAFCEYQYYLEHYAGASVSGLASYAEIVSAQFAIANALREKVESAFGAPLSTVTSMYRHIVKNAPDWEKAADCVFFEALTFEVCGKLERAVPVYERLCVKYPANALVADARYRAAFCRYRISAKAKNDERSAANALQALRLATRFAPEHPDAAKAMEAISDLSRRLSAMAYQKAAFYDRGRKNPEAAKLAYRQFLEQYPAAEEAPLVKARLVELEQP